VFNALRSDELLVGVGRVLRQVATVPRALEEYERSQALSAYSVTRLLAAEQRSMAGLLAQTKEQLVSALGPDDRSEVRALGERIAAATDGIEVGDAVASLLSLLGPDETLRASVHRILATMIDDEVAALADVAR
jgi:hypothetical protein